MPVDETYRKQVSLLVKIVPLVATETVFALKGGTALNLFLRDMPRLSVDIDLTYVPVKDRASSLKEIDAALRRIARAIERGIPGAKVSASAPKGEEVITKLMVPAQPRPANGGSSCAIGRSWLSRYHQLGYDFLALRRARANFGSGYTALDCPRDPSQRGIDLLERRCSILYGNVCQINVDGKSGHVAEEQVKGRSSFERKNGFGSDKRHNLHKQGNLLAISFIHRHRWTPEQLC